MTSPHLGKLVTTLLAGFALAITMVIGASPAQAAQSGLQSTCTQADSWSSTYVQFNGGSASVPVGQCWGEGRADPKFGTTTTAAEPANVYVGPGWCVTRWINASSSREYFAGGGGGGWFQLWSSRQSGDYTNHLQAWYGSWCPTSGGSYRSGYAFS